MIAKRVRTPKNLTYSKVYDFALMEVFGHDRDKCNAWWMAKHEAFQDKSPYELVRDGRGQWLMRYLIRSIL